MNVKLTIFNDIKTAIESKVTIIQDIRLFNAQFDNEEREKAFNYPVVFIEFADIPWEQSNQKVEGIKSRIKEQKGGQAIVTLHIGFEHLQDETVSFELMAPILENVYFAVQTLQGDFYTPLLRIAERQDVDHDRVIDWQMDFSTKMFQCGQEVGTEIGGGTLKTDVTVDLKIDNDTIRSGAL